MFGKPNRRWIDCNSHLFSTCESTVTNISCAPGDPRELLVGDLDMDWSDKSEVTLARIIGDISLRGTVRNDGPTTYPLPLLVRFGLLVTEDTDRLYQAIDLGDPESLEEYEWMWLKEQIIPYDLYTFSEASGNSEIAGVVSIPLDTTVKRKLGKKDSLVLYSQMASQGSLNNLSFSAQYTYQLRCVMT